jgi:hypothetical protein
MSSSEQESVAPALDEETRDVLREAKSLPLWDPRASPVMGPTRLPQLLGGARRLL